MTVSTGRRDSRSGDAPRSWGTGGDSTHRPARCKRAAHGYATCGARRFESARVRRRARRAETATARRSRRAGSSAMQTTSAGQSLWLDTAPPVEHPALTAGVRVDVAVLGGGIAGLTTALLLKRQGARVAVVEAGRVGRGVTGCTTAKVSALQATVYSQIRRRHGRDVAATYAEASLAGVERLARLAAGVAPEGGAERRPAVPDPAGGGGGAPVGGEGAARRGPRP